MTGIHQSTLLAFIVLALSKYGAVSGFSVGNNHSLQRFPTRVFLKDSIADMIDNELNRLQSRRQHEQEITSKIQELKKEILPTNYEYNEDFETSSESIIQRKDRKMALNDPERYCADRCVSTGHCDVFEDMYHMSPSQVMEFCTECVLSEEEDPCDVPDSMFGDLSP